MDRNTHTLNTVCFEIKLTIQIIATCSFEKNIHSYNHSPICGPRTSCTGAGGVKGLAQGHLIDCNAEGARLLFHFSRFLLLIQRMTPVTTPIWHFFRPPLPLFQPLHLFYSYRYLLLCRSNLFIQNIIRFLKYNALLNKVLKLGSNYKM